MSDEPNSAAKALGVKIIGPLAYAGKPDCQSARCRREPNVEGGWRCVGWHCSYCDQPCSSQGHRCDAADAILSAAETIIDAEEQP